MSSRDIILTRSAELDGSGHGVSVRDRVSNYESSVGLERSSARSSGHSYSSSSYSSSHQAGAHRSSSGVQLISSSESGIRSGSTTIGSGVVASGGSTYISGSTIGSGAVIGGGTTYTSSYSSGGGYSSGYTGTHALVSKTVIDGDVERDYFLGLNDRLARYIETIHGMSLTQKQVTVVSDLQKNLEQSMKHTLEEVYNRVMGSDDDLERLKQLHRTLTNDLEGARHQLRENEQRVASHKHDLLYIKDEYKKDLQAISQLNSEIKIFELQIVEITNVHSELREEQKAVNSRIDTLRLRLTKVKDLREHHRTEYQRIKTELDTLRVRHAQSLEQVRKECSEKLTVSIRHVKLDYNARILDELRKLRAYFDRQLASRNLGDKVKLDIKSINIDVKSLLLGVWKARNEASACRLTIRNLETDIKTHASIIDAYHARIREMQDMSNFSEESRVVYSECRVKMDAALAEMRAQFGHLRELKLQLIEEINAYHELLYHEEQRLSIERVDLHKVHSIESHHHHHSSSGHHHHYVEPATTKVSTVIKKSSEHSSSGRAFVDERSGRSYVTEGATEIGLDIDDISMNGDYIHLTNKGNKDFNLASWMIKSEASGQIRKFKFQSNQYLSPGKSMKIWSPNRGGVNDPPASIVMKAVVWPAGNRIRVELLDEHEKMKAWREAYYEEGDLVKLY